MLVRIRRRSKKKIKNIELDDTKRSNIYIFKNLQYDARRWKKKEKKNKETMRYQNQQRKEPSKSQEMQKKKEKKEQCRRTKKQNNV